MYTLSGYKFFPKEKQATRIKHESSNPLPLLKLAQTHNLDGYAVTENGSRKLIYRKEGFNDKEYIGSINRSLVFKLQFWLSEHLTGTWPCQIRKLNIALAGVISNNKNTRALNLLKERIWYAQAAGITFICTDLTSANVRDKTFLGRADVAELIQKCDEVRNLKIKAVAANQFERAAGCRDAEKNLCKQLAQLYKEHNGNTPRNFIKAGKKEIIFIPLWEPETDDIVRTLLEE